MTDNGAGVLTLTKNGSGTLTLPKNNTYTGVTSINAGTVLVSNTGGLGSTANGTTVSAGASLAVNGVALLPEAITISGTSVNGVGALLQSSTSSAASVAGTVTLAADSSIGVTPAAANRSDGHDVAEVSPTEERHVGEGPKNQQRDA